MAKIIGGNVRHSSTSRNAQEVIGELNNWARAREFHDLDATPLRKASLLLRMYIAMPNGLNIQLPKDWQDLA